MDKASFRSRDPHEHLVGKIVGSSTGNPPSVCYLRNYADRKTKGSPKGSPQSREPKPKTVCFETASFSSTRHPWACHRQNPAASIFLFGGRER